MSESSLRSTRSLARTSLAVLLAGVIFLAGLISVTPGWHEKLHRDAGATMHLCVVTLFAAGHCEAHVSVTTCVTPDQPELLATLIIREAPARVKPHLFARLEHAPPAFA